MERDERPHVPVTAVVWTVRLDHSSSLPIDRLHLRVSTRFRRFYSGFTPSRMRGAVRYAAARGWLTVDPDGLRVRCTPENLARFDAEHDPGMVPGIRDRQAQDNMVAWRRANTAATQGGPR